MDIHSPVNAVDDNIISKLESTFGESLRIQDAEKSEHVSEAGDIDIRNGGERSLCGGFEQEETEIKIECLNKCSTFTYPNMILPSSPSDEADTLTEPLSAQSSNQSHPGPLPFIPQAPPKLVSAMKGSREKQGGSQKKLTVKWAPDVYDPVPTLVSHTVKSKNRHKSRIKKSEKKSSKKVHKRSYSKGAYVNDKKQNDNWWLESPDKGIETCTEFDLDVDSHDPYHGISYLKPVTESHCHAGEALNNILEFVSYIKTA